MRPSDVVDALRADRGRMLTWQDFEGVEDEDCFSYASSFPEGVLIQGYRCASPMDQDSFISFLEENAR